MPLYFFHLLDGQDILLDPEGREIGDPALIPEEAVKEARAIISHDALNGRIELHQSIVVRDSKGELVHRLPFRDAITLD